MSGECQVNVKSQSELDIGGRETCSVFLKFIELFRIDEISLSFKSYFQLTTYFRILWKNRFSTK